MKVTSTKNEKWRRPKKIKKIKTTSKKIKNEDDLKKNKKKNKKIKIGCDIIVN